MKELTEELIGTLMLLGWVAGAALAKGALSTFFAVAFPPWGWYLVVELAMGKWGLV